MALIGLNHFYYSHLSEADDGTVTYDGAKSFGKAVSCNVSVTNNSAALYADDALAESDTSFQSGTVTLGVDDDRETTFADILGHTIEDGLVTYNGNDTAPWVSLARIVVKLVNNVKIYKVEVLRKVKFSDPSSSNQTKGESVEFTTPEIEGTIATLKSGEWKLTKNFSSLVDAIAYIQALFAASGSKYRVSYNANGGSGTISDQLVNVGSSVTLSVGTSLTPPTNKVFSGWALSSSATVKEFSAGDTFTPLRDVTLYAVYVDDE